MLVDFHCDTISELLNNGGELASNDLSVDLEKLKTAGSLAQVFALYVDLRGETDPLVRGRELLSLFQRELAKNARVMSLAVNRRDIDRHKREGKISALLAVEDGGVFKGRLPNFNWFFARGMRIVTLTWNYPNEIGYPNCRPEFQTRGLTEFGRELVATMNRQGVIVDVSHLSDQGFYDVAGLATKPFMASHSNARTITDHPRNLTDDMLRTLAAKGGVVGINFANDFLGSPAAGRVTDMIRHIKHIKQVAGLDIIALGSDFDGIDIRPEIADISQLGKLAAALATAGFKEPEIERIFYQNALRFIGEVLP